MADDPQTLAQRVRAKYPGAYDDLSDQDLEAKVKAKYPGVYDDLPTTPQPSFMDRMKTAASQTMHDVSPARMLDKGMLPVVTGSLAGAATGGAMAIPVAGATAMLTSAAQGGTPSENVTQGLMGAGGEAAGLGVAALKPFGARLMQSALKPGVKDIFKDVRAGLPVPQVVQTLLDEGINVTHGGLAKLQGLLGQANKAVSDAIAPLTGQIDRPVVAARALSVGKKMANQTNPTSDLKALGDAVDEFLNPPVNRGPLSPQEAQKMKIGTYQQIGDKYNTPAALNPAQVQAQMAFAKGLKEEIEHLATAQGRGDVRALNAREGRLLEALDDTAKRVAQAGNMNPAGFAFVAHTPMAFIAALMDKSPVVKSMLARGLYQNAARVSGVSPTLLKSAVQLIASSPDTSTDTPTASTAGQ
jgi:hypothetical protein